MNLIPVTATEMDVDIALAYATADNFTGRPVYRRAACWLLEEAADRLRIAARMAARQGFRLQILDAFRPQEAQRRLWAHTPDPDFLADPRRGSHHSRGAAVDLQLLDTAGRPLDFGTAFDAFTPLSHHGAQGLAIAAERHRLLLLGIMTAAGWDFFRNEWWHYQLFDAARRFPLLSDSVLPRSMME